MQILSRYVEDKSEVKEIMRTENLRDDGNRIQKTKTECRVPTVSRISDFLQNSGEVLNTSRISGENVKLAKSVFLDGYDHVSA